MATDGRNLGNLGRQCVLSGKGVGRDLSGMSVQIRAFHQEVSLAGVLFCHPETEKQICLKCKLISTGRLAVKIALR